jgi:copper chaperone CopZ
MKRVAFDVTGMSCGHCVRHVTEALRLLDGVTVGNVAVGSAEVDFDPAKTSAKAIADALGAAGYPARERGGGLADRLACHPAEPGNGGGGCCCG